ncbi:MAG: heme ABC exporter ATP-binding protein CcmA [Pseudomonadota bacterium]
MTPPFAMRQGGLCSGMGLTIDSLTLSRGGRTVIDGLTVALAEGGALVLRGANGAGKSTLLRAIAGLGRIDRGTVALRLDGEPADLAEHIAYAGHLDAVKPQLTLAENLTFWSQLTGGAPGAVDAALQEMGLDRIADQPASTCSAGQRRRLGLARLLLAPRALWLLDEPTVSLDAASTAALARHIAAQSARGGMVLVATHIDLALPQAQFLDLQPPTSLPGDHAEDPFLSSAFG